ncbi:MAG: OadG family protein [Clostridia bacterium]|nr:OadG family protein [Clostridia bacterium]
MGILNALSYGGITAVIGMFIVFLGLTILICAVKIMGAVFAGVTAKKQAKARAAVVEKPAAPAPAPAAAPEPVMEDVTDDSELIAVIAAAIAAFDNSGKSLVVRRVRKVSGWNRASRAEQVYRF